MIESIWNWALEKTREILNTFMWTIEKAGEILTNLFCQIGSWIETLYK